ncbi:hypothetical protein [Paenibacillus soyae]|uniref:Uncharacterized protein n=1 Tax=Paenibacillus soyae TaxID=2969249 RepID=A0A9X2MU80_9BACL|nr:hypothetical protein [Paenibacillus soyae]MCR2805861.1 hypothetical protein [Paenibacillus soyae]
MKKVKIDINSLSLLFIKMAFVATAIEAILSYLFYGIELVSLLTTFLVYCVGLSFIYGCALALPPKIKNNPLTLSNDILDAIYPDAVEDLYLDDENRGVFTANTKVVDGVSITEFEPADNAHEIFVMLNTYQKVLVTIKSNRSKEIYDILENYKVNAKFMMENPGGSKPFSKS